MRLLTHNQLCCVKKGCGGAYPLTITCTKMEQERTDVNVDFILHVLPTLEYKVLHNAITNDLKIPGLPDALPSDGKLNAEEHKEVINVLHTLICDTHIIEGRLTCGKCARDYPIQSGIPNMRLNEDEV